MSGPANVTSIEAVKHFRVAMQQFDSEAHDAVIQLILEMRKAVDWIEIDRARYWPNEARKASNAVAEARINLERCQMSINPDDKRSCYDEKKALEQAKARLRTTQEKVRIVKHWQMKVKHEAEEFETQMAKLSNMLDTEMPRAVAALQRMTRALDRYTQKSEVTKDTSRSPDASDSSRQNETSEKAEQ